MKFVFDLFDILLTWVWADPFLVSDITVKCIFVLLHWALKLTQSCTHAHVPNQLINNWGHYEMHFIDIHAGALY